LEEGRVATRNRAFICFGVLSIAASALGFAGSTPAKAGPNNITFATPVVMDPIHNGGEPTIVHSPATDNTVYASSPWGTGTQRSIWDASADGGETFRIVNQCLPAAGEVATSCPAPSSVTTNGITSSPNPPGGGDTDQRLDSHGVDYFADLWALVCDRMAKTSDNGASALQNPYGCNNPNFTTACSPLAISTQQCRPDGSDRQWLLTVDPALLPGNTATPPNAGLKYMEYNNLQTIQNGCSYWVKSSDGLNYTAANNNLGNFGCDGYPSADQVTGDVFETADCGDGASVCLNIGEPDASGNLCFLDDPHTFFIDNNAHTCGPANDPTTGGNSIGHSLIKVATGLAGSPDLLFTVSSMDTGRNLHVTWVVNGGNDFTKYQAFTTVAAASSNWTQFAKPVQLSASNTLNVFPWLVAGDPGRSDSVWYGTTAQRTPNTNTGQVWNVYMGQVFWPLLSDNKTVDITTANATPPTPTTVIVSPHPNHYNSICLAGTGCILQTGDRNLADFFSVTIDHNGAAEVEYNDTSNQLLQPGFSPPSASGNPPTCNPPCGLADHPGAPVITIAHQDGGPGLLVGKSPSSLSYEPTSAPTVGMTDPSGDALYPVIKNSTNNAANQPAFDLLSNHLSLSGSQLTVTMTVADLTAGTMFTDQGNVVGASHVQYVTRWLMCPSPTNCDASHNPPIFYAMMETNSAARQAGQDRFYAGMAQSIDLCSVSACDPHVTVYPDPGFPATGNATGSVSCPMSPSASNPCTITINVPLASIGNPTSSNLLEEVGSYAFGSARPQSAETNPNAEADQLPLEIDGICCFNFGPSNLGNPIPEAPLAAALAGVGIAMIGVGVWRQRRLRRVKIS
jgi:uncharacterized membrane protein YtjA (UPF0391 family)